MEMPIKCDGCREMIELNDAYGCYVCRDSSLLFCFDCYTAHDARHQPTEFSKED